MTLFYISLAIHIPILIFLLIKLQAYSAENRKLKENRAQFLRTLMHEVKMPIAKMQLVGALMEDEKLKNKLERNLFRIEDVLDRLSTIEMLTSGEYSLQKKHVSVTTLLDTVLKKSGFDLQNIDMTIKDDLLLEVDENLFLQSLKELIENALGHASDHKLSIVVDRLSVSFHNNIAVNTPLLARYIDGQKEHKQGVGLQFTSAVMQAHNLQLTIEQDAKELVIRFTK
ncbi:MAG: hypothetical protein WBF77_00930 [Sulfurimonadaceae bacterium]